MTQRYAYRITSMAKIPSFVFALCFPTVLGAATELELTGTVRDAETRQPIEGAYVVASYKVLRSGADATASFCTKTRGMYTGADGAFRFPVEKLDGRNPFTANAIKPGYFWKDTDVPSAEAWKRQTADAYRGRDIYLKKQDPKKVQLRFSDLEVLCHEAPTRDAAAAGAQFLKIQLEELQRHHIDERKMAPIRQFIATFEALPEK